MSAQGTTDAVGAQQAPGTYSMRDLLRVAPAANAICTPPAGAEPPEPEPEPELSAEGEADASWDAA